MKTILLISLLVGIQGFFVLAYAENQPAKHKLEITDPAGDLETSSHPAKDVVKAIINSDGKTLDIAILLKEPAKFYLDGHPAGDVAVVYLDTDNNPKNGGKPFGYKGSGFNYYIEVGACIEYEGNGIVCAGAMEGVKAKNFFSTYALYQYTADGGRERLSEAFKWKSRGKDIKDNRIEVSLDYAKLNLSPGQTIRVMVEEEDASFDKGYMPEALLTIK